MTVEGEDRHGVDMVSNDPGMLCKEAFCLFGVAERIFFTAVTGSDNCIVDAFLSTEASRRLPGVRLPSFFEIGVLC